LEKLVVREIKRCKQKQNDLIFENQNPRMIVYSHLVHCKLGATISIMIPA